MGGRPILEEPKDVPKVDTPYRQIVTQIPYGPDLALIRQTQDIEPRSMGGQPPIIWREAKDYTISDGQNKWLDWSGGVLITNVGHNNERVVAAIDEYGHSGAPLVTYCFYHPKRMELVKKLHDMMPEQLGKVYLVTTGSEATEAAMKLAFMYGNAMDPKKTVMVSHEYAFHGRTLGAHLAGGALGGGGWTDALQADAMYVKVPHPSGPGKFDTSFGSFTDSLAAQNVDPKNVAGVIFETFPGRNAALMPPGYARDLRQWATDNGVVLIADEVQGGFGRTGKMFAYQHYDSDGFEFIPDLIACGKGMSSSLPIAAVLGKAEYLDIPGIREMTSTHSGSPLPVVATIAALDELLKDDQKIIREAAGTGEWLQRALNDIARPYGDSVYVSGIGMVAALTFLTPEAEPDTERAHVFVEQAIYGGNMLFAPVGIKNSAAKFGPSLTTPIEAMEDGIFGPHGLRDALKETMER